MLTVWSSSSSSAGSGMPSSPRYRERASKESSSFENAGLGKKKKMGVNWRQVRQGEGHGVLCKAPRPVAQPLPSCATLGKSLNLVPLQEMGMLPNVRATE